MISTFSKDGSTMLIEAAKGGHAQVVKFLLEWTGNGNNSNELSPSSPTHVGINHFYLNNFFCCEM